MSILLEIENLHVRTGDAEILKGISLIIQAGETHAIMGPNGSGKSTLSNIIAGKPGYEITQGTIKFNGALINEMPPEERARAGIFIGFQYPVAIPGVNTMQFIRTSVNSVRKHRQQPEYSASEFLQKAKAIMQQMRMSPDLIKRSLNDGFSGGEKKRNEILQMTMLEPHLAVLDEMDSGLDIDALQDVASAVNRFKNEKNALLLITHYQRLLSYIIPDYIHILQKGKITRSGGKELALELEKSGYETINETQSA